MYCDFNAPISTKLRINQRISVHLSCNKFYPNQTKLAENEESLLYQFTQHTAFGAPISTKLITAWRYCMANFYIKFSENRNLYKEIMGRNSFTSPKEIHTHTTRCSKSSYTEFDANLTNGLVANTKTKSRWSESLADVTCTTCLFTFVQKAWKKPCTEELLQRSFSNSRYTRVYISNVSMFVLD